MVKNIVYTLIVLLLLLGNNKFISIPDFLINLMSVLLLVAIWIPTIKKNNDQRKED